MRGCDKAKKQTGPLFRHLCLLCHYYISFFQSEQELFELLEIGGYATPRKHAVFLRLALNGNDYFRFSSIH